MRPLRQPIILSSLFAFSLFFTSLCFANTAKNDGSLVFWIYAILSSDTTKSKANNFINAMTKETNLPILSHASSDVESLLGACQQGRPAIILVPKPLGDAVNEKCGYTAIAYTFQDIYLFMKEKTRQQPRSQLVKIGLIRHTLGGDIARQELPQHFSNIRFNEYINVLDLIRSQKNDRLDAVVFPLALVRNVKVLQDYKPLIKFEKQGQVTVMASPKMNQVAHKKVSQFILSNSSASKAFLQDFVGLGPFVAPH